MKLDLMERMMLILAGIGIRYLVIKLNEPGLFKQRVNCSPVGASLVLRK
jgi:hypothetical protein